MWVKLGIVGGVFAAAWWLLRFTRRKRNRPIDVGSVSAAWLAEERGRSSPE